MPTGNSSETRPCISPKWFPDFANFRRQGYDFDARYDDGLEYAYDAYFDDWDGIYTLKGVVKNISVYYEKFELVSAPGHNMLKPVPETSQVITTASSEDVEKYRGELQVSGNIVELDEVTVNLAKQIPGCKNH